MQIMQCYVFSDNNKALPSKEGSRRPPDPAYGGTPRTHPIFQGHRTAPHVPLPSVTGDTRRCTPSPGQDPQSRFPCPRCQHLGQRPGLRGAPRLPALPAAPRHRGAGQREVGNGRAHLTALDGLWAAGRGAVRGDPPYAVTEAVVPLPGRGPRLPEPSSPTPYPQCGIRCSPSLRQASGKRRQPQQRGGGEGREGGRSERSWCLQRETPGWPSRDRRGVMVRYERRVPAGAM